MEASASIYLEKTRINKDGKHAVKLRVSQNKTRKYYSIKHLLKINEWNYLYEDSFNKVMQIGDYGKSSPRGVNKDIRVNLNQILAKAETIIGDLGESFSFNKFDIEFNGNRGDWNYLYHAFESYIEDLKNDNRLGYATTFNSTLTGIKYFAEDKPFPKGVKPMDHKHFHRYKEIKFIDITPAWLKRYEKFLENNKRSKSTRGINARNIRVLFNVAIKEHRIKAEYPFDKYKPDQSENKKRALTAEQVSAIVNYKAPEGTRKQMWLDLFKFSFLANGMNIGDILNLKFENIKSDEIEFVREKTKRKKKEVKISVAYTRSLQEIIKQHGNIAINNDVYVFPIFRADMSENTKRNTKKQFTKRMNAYLKQVAIEVGIDSELAKSISTYYARHSFATILKNSGTSQEYLKEALGHESIKTTEKYLSSFERAEKKKQAEKLESMIKKIG